MMRRQARCGERRESEAVYIYVICACAMAALAVEFYCLLQYSLIYLNQTTAECRVER